MVCSIQVYPLKVARRLGLKRTGAKKEGRGTDPLKFMLSLLYTPFKMVWDSACVGDMKLLLSKYMEILF